MIHGGKMENVFIIFFYLMILLERTFNVNYHLFIFYFSSHSFHHFKLVFKLFKNAGFSSSFHPPSQRTMEGNPVQLFRCLTRFSRFVTFAHVLSNFSYKIKLTLCFIFLVTHLFFSIYSCGSFNT